MSVIAATFFLAAAGSAVTAAATAAGWWPLAWGRYVAGDLVTMGPAAFVIAALLYAVIGFGLFKLKDWGRRAAIVVAAVGLYFLIGPISSAVVGVRIGAIAVNGTQIIVRVLVLWYLMQQQAEEAFTRSGEWAG